MPVFPETNIDLFYMGIYGGFGYDCSALSPIFLQLAAGIAQPGNPPFTVNTLLAMYPKFFGAATSLTAAFTTSSTSVPVPNNAQGFAVGQLVTLPSVLPDATVISEVALGSAVVVGDTLETENSVTVESTAGLLVGQPISGDGIPGGTFISAVNSATVFQISQNATATASDVTLTVTTTTLTLSAPATATGAYTASVYVAPLVPLFVIQTYINLANASLMSSRWRSSWTLGMCLYVAHFLTLYLQTDGNPQTTAGQAVANGIQAGITVSKGADGVSQGLQPLAALNGWAAWTLTSYGAQLATMGRVVGAGAVYFR
jgi:hypothetical protein